jgi:CheY-like chemotaxis protein
MAKVLVIDDEPNVRILLDMRLRHHGYDVLFADNGWKGLELYNQDHPDVIVLDLKMPGMDGLTVLQEIRSFDPRQPVIVLTGAGTAEAEQQVRAFGVTEYVEKEFSLHRLGDSLNRLLNHPDLST